MNLNDIFHLYAIRNRTDTDGMLLDYPLDSRLNREHLNGKILLDLGSMEPLYNDTRVMKFAIDNWFATHYAAIAKMCDALAIQYDPLHPHEMWEHNTDVQKQDAKYEDNREFDRTGKVGEETNDRFDRKLSTVDSTLDETKQDQYISAFNGGNQPQANTDSSETTDETVLEEGYTTDKTNKDRNEKVGETENNIRKETGTLLDDTSDKHQWGIAVENIASIIRSEYELGRLNVYEWIVQHLEPEITIGVY